MELIRAKWNIFEEKHTALAKWIYEIGFFLIISNGVTIFQYLVFTFMPRLLGEKLAGMSFMWPRIPMQIFGVSFDWCIFGAEVLYDESGAVMIGGGLGYFISYEVGTFLAQCINFPLQRNVTFKSKGKIGYQAMWYFIAWVILTILCNAVNNLWMPIAATHFTPAVYNVMVTVITGGISMVVFFFVFKIIFPEKQTEQK